MQRSSLESNIFTRRILRKWVITFSHLRWFSFSQGFASKNMVPNCFTLFFSSKNNCSSTKRQTVQMRYVHVNWQRRLNGTLCWGRVWELFPKIGHRPMYYLSSCFHFEISSDSTFTLVHTNESHFKCMVCSFEFKSSCTPKRRMRTHITEAFYKCDIAFILGRTKNKNFEISISTRKFHWFHFNQL